MYTKEQVIAIELKHAKSTARDYAKAEQKYLMSRGGCLSDKEECALIDDALLQARVLVAHILNLVDIDDTVKFYNTPNTLARH